MFIVTDLVSLSDSVVIALIENKEKLVKEHAPNGLLHKAPHSRPPSLFVFIATTIAILYMYLESKYSPLCVQVILTQIVLERLNYFLQNGRILNGFDICAVT